MTPDLAATYAAAIYTAELPDGRVEFRIGNAPRGPAPSDALAIITAWNPGHKRPGRRANRQANRRLAADLERARLAFYPATGRSADGAHAEPSFAVMAVTQEEALAIACRFRQAALLYWDGRTARLLWTDDATP